MPARLRPTAPLATHAILVGDPGRALLLAQTLLEQPKMSNHARGLWGYSGRTAVGDELTVQSTGMGGPSAALVLADLAKLGVRRAIRVGTCVAVAKRIKLGELLLPNMAVAGGGSAISFGLAPGDSVAPDRALHDKLARTIERADDAETQVGPVASLDVLPRQQDDLPPTAVAVDMQTVAVLARADELDLAVAAVLVVSEAGTERLDDEALAGAARKVGTAAARALSQAG